MCHHETDPQQSRNAQKSMTRSEHRGLKQPAYAKKFKISHAIFPNSLTNNLGRVTPSPFYFFVMCFYKKNKGFR
jgi:hypothetical protein